MKNNAFQGSNERRFAAPVSNPHIFYMGGVIPHLGIHWYNRRDRYYQRIKGSTNHNLTKWLLLDEILIMYDVL
jgi:hypothetical protein